MTPTRIARISAGVFLALALALLPSGICASAQDSAPAQDKPITEGKPSVIEKPKSRQDYLAPYAIPSIEHTRTFYLKNSVQQNDANEILVAVRNMVALAMRIYFVAAQNAIVISGPPDQIALAEKIIQDLDRPQKTYRITYTLTESDSGKRIGTQHFSVIAVTGQRTQIKQGSKVPIATGRYDDSKNSNQEQFTYLDVGMNIDTTINQLGDGLHLKTKVERSSISEEKSSVGANDPIVRQAVLEGTSNLTIGRPLALGQIDIPDSTRHLDIEVVAEPIP